MKMYMCLLVALALVSTICQAQSNATVYGLMDAAVVYTDNANASKNHVVRMKSGGMNTSRFGFRGSEDLGNGLAATFQLESGIQIDTGVQDDSTSLFNRQANVGLQGAFGKIIVGRSYSTTYDFVLPFDPLGYAPLYSWAVASTATPVANGVGLRKDGLLSGVSNLIKYQGTFGPLKLGATYALGEEAGSSRGLAKYGIAAAYNAGPIGMVVTLDRQNGATTTAGARDLTETAHFGLSYKIQALKLFAAYRDYKKSFATNAAEQRSNTSWLGATYNVTPAMGITGVVYHQDIKSLPSILQPDPTNYVAHIKYALSKRTDLYSVLAYAKSKHGLNVSVSRDDAGFANTQTSLATGIQHRF